MVDGGEPGVDSRDERKHIGRNDLLFVESTRRDWSHVGRMQSSKSITSICCGCCVVDLFLTYFRRNHT